MTEVRLLDGRRYDLSFGCSSLGSKGCDGIPEPCCYLAVYPEPEKLTTHERPVRAVPQSFTLVGVGDDLLEDVPRLRPKWLFRRQAQQSPLGAARQRNQRPLLIPQPVLLGEARSEVLGEATLEEDVDPPVNRKVLPLFGQQQPPLHRRLDAATGRAQAWSNHQHAPNPDDDHAASHVPTVPSLGRKRQLVPWPQDN